MSSSVERHVFKTRTYYCAGCDDTKTHLAWDYNQLDCGTCGNRLQEAGTSRSDAPNVIGDECDVVVKHGICWPDGTPRHYGSKSEMRRVAAEMGLQQHVEHVPSRGSDKSPHTTKWV